MMGYKHQHLTSHSPSIGTICSLYSNVFDLPAGFNVPLKVDYAYGLIFKASFGQHQRHILDAPAGLM